MDPTGQVVLHCFTMNCFSFRGGLMHLRRVLSEVMGFQIYYVKQSVWGTLGNTSPNQLKQQHAAPSCPSFLKVIFWFPKWRSLRSWKGHLLIQSRCGDEIWPRKLLYWTAPMLLSWSLRLPKQHTSPNTSHRLGSFVRQRPGRPRPSPGRLSALVGCFCGTPHKCSPKDGGSWWAKAHDTCLAG